MRALVACLFLSACSGGGTSISMSFARAGLYDAPFPSDDLRRADGTVDVSKVPNPNQVDLINQALGLLTRDARGFALAGGIFFRASAPLDATSLPDVTGSLGSGATVFVVAVDPASPEYLQRRPLDVAFLEDGGPFGDKNLLAALPIQGIPLRPSTRYAAVVTTGVRDAQHQPLARMQALTGTVAAEYDDAIAQLAPLVPAEKIAGLAVFTTDDPAAQLARVRDDALASHPLGTPTAPTLTTVYPDYCVYGATLQVPDYQSGTPPYSRAGGDWRFDDSGHPQLDHFETARIVFTVPRAPTPAAGWPTVVFVRTGGGGDNPLVDRGVCATAEFTAPITPGSGPAMDLARAGFAAVQIDGPLGGLRNTTNAGEDLLIFNFSNASALRDNVRQSAIELSLVARAVPSITFDTSSCPGAAAQIHFDGAHLALMGHSMGAWIAPLTLAIEPSLGASVLSGAGASYIANVMDKIKPLHVRPFAEILLDYNMDGRDLDAHDPALTFVQWAAEPSDPQVYTRGIAPPRHVLMLQGIVDHYILPSIANATSLSLGLDAAGPLYDADDPEEQMLGQVPLADRLPLVGHTALTLPISGNAGGATAVVVQHEGDGIEDGHEVMFQTPAPKHQYRCFLSSFARGVPIVPPDGAEDDPCP